MTATQLKGLRIEPRGDGFELSMEQWLPLPPEELFPFYADARNLERITPSLLRFEVLTPDPIEMKQGARIDYALRLHGLPMKWRTLITKWDPPHEFRDEQLRGPYRYWRHTHRFRAEGGGTMTTDTVHYAVPGGPLAPIVHAMLVKGDVLRIFEHRARVLEGLFGGARSDARQGASKGWFPVSRASTSSS